MTTMTNSRFNYPYWSERIYPSSSYFDEYSYGLDENITSYNTPAIHIKQENEVYLPPPVAVEVIKNALSFLSSLMNKSNV